VCVCVKPRRPSQLPSLLRRPSHDLQHKHSTVTTVTPAALQRQSAQLSPKNHAPPPCRMQRQPQARHGAKESAGKVLKIKLVPCGTDGRLLLSGFQALVILTLTLDRVIRHTVVHQSSISIYISNFIEIGKTFLGTDYP